MSAVVKTLIQGRPVGKDFFLSSNIPFLDRDRPDAFSTRFQEEYRPFTSKKAEPFSPPTAAQVDHKDLRHIKEYRTDAKESYHAHKMPQITRIPAWTMLQTNFKMQTDPGEEAFLTTQSQQFCHQPFQPPPSPIRQIETPKAIQHAEKLPESTNQASYTPHNCCPVLKASAKHLGKWQHSLFILDFLNTKLNTYLSMDSVSSHIWLTWTWIKTQLEMNWQLVCWHYKITVRIAVWVFTYEFRRKNAIINFFLCSRVSHDQRGQAPSKFALPLQQQLPGSLEQSSCACGKGNSSSVGHELSKETLHGLNEKTHTIVLKVKKKMYYIYYHI